MNTVLEFLKSHVKASVTVVVVGVALTVGWAKGCTVDVGVDTPVTVEPATISTGE